MGNLSGLAIPILVSAALKSTLVLGAAWLVALALRAWSAAARHLVWTAAAAALLALPFFSVSLPVWHVGPTGAILPANLGLVFHIAGTAGNSTAAAPVASAQAIGTAGRPAAPARQVDWKAWMMLLWAAGIALSLAQMLAACGAMWRLRRQSIPYPGSGRARALAAALGIQHDVEILETAPGTMPMTFGLLRPAIFLPRDADSWNSDRREMVLLHELAHVRRGDASTHLMARMALSLYWWNPLVWMAWREFLKERERAADDLVLNSGARAADYAGHLLEVARTLQPAHVTATAAIAMARRPSQLEGRLRAILDARINRRAPGRLAAAAAALLAVAVVAPLAAVPSQEERSAAPVFRTVATPDDLEATIQTAKNQKNHEMLDQAAEAFQKLRKFDEAQTLLQASLAIREQVSGTASVDYAVGLIQLGDLLRNRGKIADAEAAYAKAVAAVGDRPETAPALLHLSMGAYRNQEFDKAMDYAQRARNFSSAGPQKTKALVWIAQIREKQEGGAAEAETLYTAALAQTAPNTADAALAMELYARFLRNQGRAGEAEALQERAANLRKTLISGGATKRVASAVYRVGNGIAAPAVLFKIEPQYTEEARVDKISGTVLLYVVIEPDGQAANFQLLRGLGFGLDEKAIEAISQWKFRPGTKDGVPVPVEAQIEVNFRLL